MKAKGGRGKDREREWQDDLLLPLGSVISDSDVYVGRNIRKMSPTLVVLVLSSLKSVLGSNPKTGCPKLILITPHIFSCWDGFGCQRCIPSVAYNAFSVASLQTYSRNGIGSKSHWKLLFPFIFKQRESYCKEKKTHSFCFPVDPARDFNPIEQALEILRARLPCAFHCFYC